MTSTGYATGPAMHNWRHPAPKVRELSPAHAAKLGELGELLVGHLAEGALADGSFRVMPPAGLTPDQAVQLQHLLSELYAPEPSLPSITDIAAMEGAFRLHGQREVTMAICVGFELLGGELDDRQLGIEDFADQATAGRLLGLAGAHDLDPSPEERQAEQEALDAWLAELDAGLLPWPVGDDAIAVRPEAETRGVGSSMRPDISGRDTTIQLGHGGHADGHDGAPPEVRAEYDRLVSVGFRLREQTRQLQRDVGHSANPEPVRRAAAQRLGQIGRESLEAGEAETAFLRAHPELIPEYGTGVRALATGINVLPVRTDGSKGPAVRAWKQYQSQRASPDELYEWFAGGDHGIAAICGAISGGLEMGELEGRAVAEGLLEDFTGYIAEAGLQDVWRRVLCGYSEMTPSGGLHVYWRCEEITGAVKLAARPATEKELAANPKDTQKTLIETRGEGGYSVIAPTSGACHKTGRPWQVITGSLETIPTITPEEREGILACARKCSKLPAGEIHNAPERARHETQIRDQATHSPQGVPLLTRPGDVYNSRGPDWEDILGPYGWQIDHTDGGVFYWTRPGKTSGTSATTGHPDHQGDKLHVFTSATEFEPDVAYSKFAAYAILEHRGDFAAAASDLLRQGYVSDEAVCAVPPGVEAEGARWAPSREIPGDPGQDGGGRIELTNGEQIVLRLRWAIESGRMSDRLFLYGGDLVAVQLVRGERGKPRALQLTPAEPSMIQWLCAQSHLCYQLVETKSGWEVEIPALPTAGQCKIATADRSYEHVPAVSGVSAVPLLLPDRCLLQQAGYDPRTGLIYWPKLRVRQVMVTPDTVRAAKRLLKGKLLRDFPFVAPADRTNFVALLMTPILRYYAPQLLSPLGVVTATQPGSGKTYLVDTLAALYGATVRSWTGDDEEIRKAITATLRETNPVIVFDDVDRWDSVESAVLCKALTQYLWDDRLLGLNKEFHGVNDRLWLIDGNNITLGGDVPPRSVLVRLDPHMPDPESRPVERFALGDLREWLKDPAHCAQILETLLVLIMAWVQAGAPERSCPSRFPRWAAIMGGLLRFSGFGGFLGNIAAISEHVAQGRSLGEFAERWFARFGSTPQRLRPLCTEALIAGADDPWEGTWPTNKDGRQLGEAGMRRLLRAENGTYHGNYAFRYERDRHAKADVYYVERTEPKGSGGSRQAATVTDLRQHLPAAAGRIFGGGAKR